MENMSEPKRKNFTRRDKEVLTSIILNHKEVVENKKTDSATLSQKENCWKQIAEEFSSTTSVPRTVTQLKAFYKNAKCDLKKKIAQNRASIFRTGGGRPESELREEDPLLSVVLEQTQTVDNPFDSSHDLFEMLEETTTTNDNPEESEPSTSTSTSATSRRKRAKRPTPIEEEKHILFQEVAELKKQKLTSEIEKNKLKAEVYKAKLEILQNYRNNNNS